MYDTSDADGYVVYYNGTAKLVVGDMKETTLDGLIPEANYSVTVRAYQDILGPSNTTLYSTTNEGTGNNIIMQCAFLNEILLSWEVWFVQCLFIAKYYRLYSHS